jgi:hypothetical protein
MQETVLKDRSQRLELAKYFSSIMFDTDPDH